jgi:hypothetical protein
MWPSNGHYLAITYVYGQVEPLPGHYLCIWPSNAQVMAITWPYT